MSDITQILDQMARGDTSASNKLVAVVYQELRRMAAVKMAQEAEGHTLQPTALVHEAWLRLTANKTNNGPDASFLWCRGGGDSAHSH